MRIHTEIDLSLKEDDKGEEEVGLVGFESLEIADLKTKTKLERS